MPATLAVARLAEPPLSAAVDDARLVTQARDGDAAAFEAIIRRYNRLLFRTARGVVRDDAEAQDVVQETYLRAFTRLATFRAESALGTWLARIAINVALDSQRRRGRTVALDDDRDDDALAQTTEPWMHDPTADAGSGAPDAAAENAQMRRLLQSAIDALPPLYRSVFILRAVEELSVDETASCLGVSADVVRTRHLRARALLRDALGARVEAHMQETYPFAGARCDAMVARVIGALRGLGLVTPG